MKKNISIIIPVYNEEKSIEKTIEEIKMTFNNIECEYEIIAVNDGSRDNSYELLKKINNIKSLNHKRNKGYGASLKTGIKASSYDWILIIDADGTYPTENIPEMIELSAEYDLIIGSRDKHNKSIPIERRHAKRILNRFASYLAGQKIPDLNSGLRLFKKEIVLKYWRLFPDKFSFTSTLTMTCLTNKYPTKFLPIEYNKRVGKSSIRPVDFFSFIKLITKTSLYFKPLKVFIPLSLLIFISALTVASMYLLGYTEKFYDTTFIILCATALQTFFFGLLAEIITHNK